MSRQASTLDPALVQAKALSVVARATLALGIFMSGFVMYEPSPFELVMVPLIALSFLFGLRMPAYAALLLALFAAYNIGGLISMTQMGDLRDTPIYLGVSFFLALTAVYIACAVRAQPDLFPVIFNAWTAAAVATGFLGIAGYFGLFPGAEIFTRYDRAMGAFKDPNVFGPYLALPGIYMLHLVLTGKPSRLPLYIAVLLVIVAAIFVSFSRGAWGLFVVSALLMTGMLFLQSNSGLFRLRIVVMSLLACCLLILALIVALQIPGVGDFFAMRAQLVQDYDGGRLGRFARYVLGFQLAMERPLGIGPLNFGFMFGEDTHNIWLKALMDYSWLGFAAFVTMVATTLAGGLRILLRDRPWQPYLVCAYCVFVGHIGLGTVIDMDHWRHFYMLIGLIWGCFALEYGHQRKIADSNLQQSGRNPERRGELSIFPLRRKDRNYMAVPGSERSAAR